MKDYIKLVDTKTPELRCNVPPLLANPKAFAVLVAELCAPIESIDIDYVAGIDAMGFILAMVMAIKMGKGFIPIRRRGKLPEEASRSDLLITAGGVVFAGEIDLPLLE